MTTPTSFRGLTVSRLSTWPPVLAPSQLPVLLLHKLLTAPGVGLENPPTPTPTPPHPAAPKLLMKA